MSSNVRFATILITVLVLTSSAFSQARRGGGSGGRGGASGGRGGVSSSAFTIPSSGQMQQWEYGRLELRDKPEAKDGATVIWRGGNETIDGKSVRDLYQKLAGDSASTDADELMVWNLLGEKGWEFIDRQTLVPSDVADVKPRTTIIHFKRIKR